ncbi:MAG: DUF2310 family Zn-ribbon-containing protein [Stappiaceae bacterium]
MKRVSIRINSDISPRIVIEKFESLMAFYRGNGQVLGKVQSEYISGNTVIGMPYTPEEGSLSRELNNHYVKKQIEWFEEHCRSDLKIETAGTAYEKPLSVCQCEKPQMYILEGSVYWSGAPVACGNCYRMVPLYRLPIYYDHGYMPILRWQTNYHASEDLFMNDDVGERWARGQMQNVRSQLSQQGLEISANIAELTGTPTYYHLFNYRYRQRKDQARICPKCKNDWVLSSPLHDAFHYKCDECFLLSSHSNNF